MDFICSDLTVWRIGSECKNNKTTVTLPAGKWVQWVALLDSPGNEDEAYVLTGPPPYTLLCVNLRCIEQNHEMQATNQWPCPFYVEPWVIKLDSGYILLGSVYGIVLLSENKVDSLFLNSSPEAPPLKVDDTHFLKPVGDGRTTMELHNANEESWKDQPERDKKNVSGYQGHFNDEMCHNGFVVLVGESHVDLVDALTGTWIMRRRLHLHSSFGLYG